MAKEFLSQNHIHYTEKRVDEDPAAAQELQRRNVRGVPAFLIGDDLVIGFDRNKLLSLVDHRLVSCEKCSQKMRVPKNKGKIKVKCLRCSHEFMVTT